MKEPVTADRKKTTLLCVNKKGTDLFFEQKGDRFIFQKGDRFIFGLSGSESFLPFGHPSKKQGQKCQACKIASLSDRSLFILARSSLFRTLSPRRRAAELTVPTSRDSNTILQV
jgi:hypothetical protein